MSTQTPDSIEWWYCSNSHGGGDKRDIIIRDGPTRVVIHSNLCAGIQLGTLPAAEALQGVRRMSAPPPLIQDTNRVPAATQSMSEVATLVTSQSMSSSAAPISTVATAPGLPPLAKKLAESILAGNYVDFAELPPAKGRCKLLQSTEGQLVLIHAADLLQSKRLIPDLATWCQCFAIFAAVVTSRHPERTASLMAYLAAITKASTRYKWPSWVVYDLNYRQNATDTGQTDWSRIDPGLYAECFNNMAISAEGWCTHCYSTEHTSDNCILRPLSKKRPQSSAAAPPAKRQEPVPICKKFNIFNGDCSFGTSCRYIHACLHCKQAGHPKSQCPQLRSQKSPGMQPTTS